MKKKIETPLKSMKTTGWNYKTSITTAKSLLTLLCKRWPVSVTIEKIVVEKYLQDKSD